MELEQAKKRVEELRTVIEKNNRLYYDQDAPELVDFEYDALTRELKELEAQFPELVTPTSPTQHVGGTPSGRFAKVTHAVKMESLLDAFSFEELRDFDRRVREAGVEPEYVVEIKIDGLSCSLEYENGMLVRASTRGDGVVGEQPRLEPGQGFRYSSGAVIETPVGSMQGSYQMVTDDGAEFDAPIAPFRLAKPGMLH